MFYSVLLKESKPTWIHGSIEHLVLQICTPHIDQAPSELDQSDQNSPLILQDLTPVQP